MKHKRNQGFTLVELLVSIAVLSIVTLGIGGLLRLAAVQYSNATKETEVQNLLQSSFASVTNSLVDAIYVKVDGNDVIIANSEKILRYTYSSANKTLYYDEIDYSDDDLEDSEKIEEAKNSPATGTSVANILADKVTAFSIDPHLNEGYVALTMTVTFRQRTKSLAQNVFVRNLKPKTKVPRSTSSPAATGPVVDPDDPDDPDVPGPSGSDNTIQTSQVGAWGNIVNPKFTIPASVSGTVYLYVSEKPSSAGNGWGYNGTPGAYDPNTKTIKLDVKVNAGELGIQLTDISASATIYLIVP